MLMSLALKGRLRLADFILLGTNVSVFLLCAGAWTFGLRIFPLNRVIGWTGGYREPSYHLSNQAFCVFLAVAVILMTVAQTRIPQRFGHTHSSPLLRLFLTGTLISALLMWAWSLYKVPKGPDDIANLLQPMIWPCLELSVAVAVLNILWSIFRKQPV
jgi:hypothetical protein